MAIRMRYGTDAEWEAGKSNLVTGEPAVTTDTERAFIGTNGLLGADYSDGNISYMELANLKRIAPQHDIYERYKVGDLVFYHGELYECTIPYRGVFNTIYFKRVSLGDVISGLRAKDMYANFESTSASGDIVSIDNGAGDIPIKELVTEITATQDLHGYDAPWAGGLGKNIWHYSDVTYTHNGVTFTVSNNIATVNGTATGGDAYIPMFISGAFEANQPYTISGCPSGGSLSTYFLQQNYWGGSQQAGAQDVGSGRTFTPLNSTIHVTYIFIKEGYTANNLVFKIMLEKGSTKSAYEPYANICPINGFDEVVTYVRGKNLWTGENSITVQSAGGGFYIGFSTLASSYKISIPKGTVYFKGHWGGSSSAGQETRFYYADGTTVRASLNTLSPNSDFTLSATLEKDAVGMFMYINQGGTLSNIMLTYEESADFESYIGASYTTDLDGTRYGGTLNVTTGVLTLTHGFANVSADWFWTASGSYPGSFYTTSPSNYKAWVPFICSHAKCENNSASYKKGRCFIDSSMSFWFLNAGATVQDWKDYITAQANAGTPITVCYELATPQTVQLTPQEIQTLYKNNNIWTNCGETVVVYRVTRG